MMLTMTGCRRNKDREQGPNDQDPRHSAGAAGLTGLLQKSLERPALTLTLFLLG